MTTESLDLLLSRIVVGEADDREWGELVRAAERDPRLWRELAELHRDQSALARAVETAATMAETVPGRTAIVPDSAAASSALRSLRPARAWGGWAAAALLALAWVIGLPARRPAGEGRGVMTAGVAPPMTADEAFDAYMTRGRETGLVIGEVPTKVLVESRPVPGGPGIEIIYLRQVLERTTVPDLYRFGAHDDGGRPTLVRLDQTPRGPM
jgi:hypothetical protein